MSTVPSDIMEAAQDVVGNGPEFMLPDHGVNLDALVLEIAKAIVAERKRCAEIADSFTPGGLRYDYDVDVITCDKIRKEIIGDIPLYRAEVISSAINAFSRNHSKAESSREATPAVETDKAKRGADTLVTVCPALIDDVGSV